MDRTTSGLIAISISVLVPIFGIFKFVNSKISRIYDIVNDDYVRKDSCEIIESHTKIDINRLENKIDKVENKIDKVLIIVMEMHNK